MHTTRLNMRLAAFVFLLLPIPLNAQADNVAHPYPAVILDRIPNAYRMAVQRFLVSSDAIEKQFVGMNDQRLTEVIMILLGRNADGAKFLLDRLENEPEARWRIAIIRGLGSWWLSHPESLGQLESHIASDPDSGVSLEALELLRHLRMSEMGGLLQRRLAVARNSGDAKAIQSLGEEEELWYSLTEKIALPSFLRTPPPLFSLKAADQPVRLLAFGDFGTGSPAQVALAKGMLAYHQTHPFDFGLTLGDNFYGSGMTSPDDPRWRTQWEELYGPLKIPFYATLGNHDWDAPESPAAEILYSRQSPSWRLPAPYYTFTAGAVQFFAFDTVECNEAELRWLDGELEKSKAVWKVVYGHYHIYSATRGDNKILIDRLLPILKKRGVDVYLNGHDHNLQEEQPEGSVHFFVSGGGGASLYDFTPYPRAVFRAKENGFTVIDADANELTVRLIGANGTELHQRKLTAASRR